MTDQSQDPTHPGGEEAQRGRLLDLSEDECWELVSGSTVGRLVWNGSEGLTAVPVNYALDGHTVRARTSAYSAAARECDDSPVAFQVDLIDRHSRAGWSVLVRGRAHIDYARTGTDDVDVWPEGRRPLQLRVEPQMVTGRRLQVG